MAKQLKNKSVGGNRGVRMDKPESSDVTIQIKEHRQCLSGLVIAGTENKTICGTSDCILAGSQRY